MPSQYSDDERAEISKAPLQHLRSKLRRDYLELLKGYRHDYGLFVRSAVTTSDYADFFDDALTTLARTTFAKSTVRNSESLRESILKFRSHWPKIISINPSLVEPCATLIDRIISDIADDFAVWAAVFDLLTVFFRPATPPAAVSTKSGAFDTPARPNSGNRMTEKQTHEMVDPYVRAEIRGTIFNDVFGFHRFFSPIKNLSGYALRRVRTAARAKPLGAGTVSFL
jgi:hypothetical protein